MGALNFKRHRLQGRTEGGIRKLRAERETFLKKTKQTEVDDEELGVGRRLARRLEGEFEQVAVESGLGESKGSPASNDRSKVNLVVSSSPPPAPITMKRSQFMALVDGDDDEDLGVVGSRLARKLEEEFNQVAVESGLGKNRDGSNMVDLVGEVEGSKSMSKKGSAKTRIIRENGGSSGTGTSSSWANRGSIRGFR
ncbi:uncharacterized protein LOC132273007 [Cornus florida]|uniref:uncharacterized protein LOC132273007 n=1 Tax=Cornus florida TaxID=4283 RepID=UPI00289C4FB2|nr:uncharacterized protein LOC132273007 [Cornus florida]